MTEEDQGILPGLWIEDLRENTIRVRGQQSIEDDDEWVVFGFYGKKCVSAQGWRLKANATLWEKKLRKWKLRTRVLPRSKVKVG